MSTYPGWYPPSQVCYPPELPAYLKNVYDLKPIVGVPRDDEVIGIHAVMNTAHRVLGVPGMDDPGLFMKLADHLFRVQMARYRSKYSLITFPSDATYTPPALPSHVSIHLKTVSGAPSDEEITKVHDSLQAYQEFRRIPSMFDTRVNMELSQHLFDIQMARYMRAAGESQPSPASPAAAAAEIPAQFTGQASDTVDRTAASTNNAGTGSNPIGVNRTLHVISGTSGNSARETIEGSHQAAEQSNVLLEVLERLTQLVEKSRQPADQPNQLVECFNQLFDRFDQLVERFTQPAQKANEIAEQSNQIAEQANQLRSQANKPVEHLGDVMEDVNRVLVGIQHAIVRSHKGNKINAIDCLVNEKGERPGVSEATSRTTFSYLSSFYSYHSDHKLSVMVDGAVQDWYLPSGWLGAFLQFYGIREGLCQDEKSLDLLPGKEDEARQRLSKYLSSCLG